MPRKRKRAKETHLQAFIDGWRLIPADMSTLENIRGRKRRYWYVVGPDNRIYSEPLRKAEALIELRETWQNWKDLQK